MVVVEMVMVGRLGQGILVPHLGHGGGRGPVGSHRVLLVVLPHDAVVVVAAYGVVTQQASGVFFLCGIIAAEHLRRQNVLWCELS